MTRKIHFAKNTKKKRQLEQKKEVNYSAKTSVFDSEETEVLMNVDSQNEESLENKNGEKNLADIREYEKLRKRKLRAEKGKGDTTPMAKKLKTMSPTERRQFERTSRAERRKKASFLLPTKRFFIQMSQDERRDHKKEQQKQRRKDASLSNPKTYKFIKLSQEEQREYKSQKQRERRLRMAPLTADVPIADYDLNSLPVDSSSVESNLAQKPIKRRRMEMSPYQMSENADNQGKEHRENENLEPKAQKMRAGEVSEKATVNEQDCNMEEEKEKVTPSIVQTRNCKVRLGLIALTEVETEGIVVPHYKSSSKSTEFKQVFSKLEKMSPERCDELKNVMNCDETKKTLDEFGCVSFDWDIQSIRNCNSMEKQSFHVTPPTIENEKEFTVASEAHLRASYLSCLLAADRACCQSLAFPILGNHEASERSVAIGLQTIFAYMHAVKKTNLQLIYITTPHVKTYDHLGKVFGYVREFDLKLWTTEKYLQYEEKLFINLKKTHSYSTIPGTDLVWRCIKMAAGGQKSETQREAAEWIHGEMCKQTGVSSKFEFAKKRNTERLSALSIINNGVGDGKLFSQNFLDIRFDMERYCGSNQILRKLWIFSYYHMYFQEHCGAELNMDLVSEQYQERKKTFEELKFVHVHVVRIWNHILERAPFKCNCSQENGYHENMMVFTTRLSHPDDILDNWIMAGRSFVFDSNSDPSFLKNYAKYNPGLIYRKNDSPKLVAVRNKEEFEKMMTTSVSTWLAARSEVFADQNEALLCIMNELHLFADVAGEKQPSFYKPTEYDEEIGRKIDQRKAAASIKLRRSNRRQLEDALQKREKLIEKLDNERYILHLLEDLEMERTLRNRYFRQYGDGVVDCKYDSIADKDPDPPYDDCWIKDGISLTIEQYIERKIVNLGISSFNFDNDNTFDDDAAPFEPIGLPVLTLNHSSTLFDKQTDYPKGLDIGDQKEVCPYCGALSYEGERSWSCCKSGAIWIPPTKQVPPEISPIFEKKFRSVLISTNAAFSMASIRYNRQTQAPGGIQSLKIKGLVSCHASAIHPRNQENPAYANFIVLELSDKEIAEKRLQKLGNKATKELKKIYLAIQKYMNKNNRLYETFKTMKDIEEDMRKSGISVEGQGIKFRIVPPNEMNGEKLKKLQAHKGVYAQPSRMEKGYISVAYTYDPELPIPRGYQIYARNPTDRPQEPLSIYSDMCDQMSYPLFFPDAIGGWGLKKFRRLDKKERIGSLFTDRVKSHVAELEEAGEDPADYYDMNNDEIKKAINEKRFTNRDDNDDENISISDDEDPMYYNNSQIIAHGELEDLQDAPMDPDEVGKMPNVRMVERGGEKYPVLDRKQKSLEIPYVTDGNPFGEDDLEGEEPEYDRYADGTDNYGAVDITGLDDYNGEEVVEEVVDEPQLSRSVQDYEDIEGEEEEVCFGDEHNAEPTSIGRSNDGVQVKNVGVRQNVSLCEYTKFIIQDRVGLPCRFQGRAGALGQLLLIDLACRIREMRMQALTIKRAIFPCVTDRSSLVQMYRRMLEKGFKGEKKLGMLVTMPSTVPGTSKYQRELVMSAVTVANTLGLPHLFITFTGNPNWPEIERACKMKHCQWADIPDIVNRVFKRRYELFLEEIVGKAKKNQKNGGKLQREDGFFGPVVWYNYSVEFQQRGMPHCHLLVCLKNPITNAAQVDKIISAEVPENPDKTDPMFSEKKDYYDLVKDLMVHFPCKNDPTAYCNKDKKPHWQKCCKGFPKKLCDSTILNENQYPDYRKNSGRFYHIYRKGQRFPAGDEYVVAHNRYLLMKYRCHMNIEVVSSIRTMKYMFKYIHKGSDRAIIEATEKNAKGTLAPDSMMLNGNVLVPKNLDLAKVQQRQREADRMMEKAGVQLRRSERVALNDCSYMMDMSAMTSCEAAWRISGFPMHGSSNIVHRAFVHEEHKDVMFISRGVSTAQVGKMVKQKSKGMMVAWFEANLNPVTFKNGKCTKDLTLPEMFQYYKFNVKNQEFIPRKYDYSGRVIGRIQAPQPRWLELTATRLLAQTVRGPKSWEDLRTYRGHEYHTCLETARARGLMNGDVEWDCAIQEVSRTDIPIECRRFFVSILVHCAPADPKGLWDRHWNQLINRAPTWSDEQKKSHALRHIQFLLARHGMTLSDFELENDYRENDLPLIDSQNDMDNPNFQRFDQSTHEREGKRMYKLLNRDQKKFVDRCIALGNSKRLKKRLVFVEGPGGTGKTFCYRVIYHLLGAAKKKTTCVSHCGIAACLLPNGCTSHRKFSIPLEVNGQMACKMALGSAEGDAMALLDCLIWDEISMTDWRIVHAVNILLQQLKNNTLPFGGVLVIMGGDWRQILPIVEGMNNFGAATYIMKNYQLWNDFEKFKLTENRRAISDPVYAERILNIGNGNDYEDKDRKMVLISKELVEPTSDLALADWVFPDVNNIDDSKSAALLTIDNKTSLRLNNIILDKLNGQLHEFFSIDTADKDNAINVDAAIFATETPSGMPPHRLRLKVGAQVVLLRNISVEQGLCNGTRLTITRFGDDIIHCTVNSPTENSPGTVYLHRMLMSATGKGAKNAGFRRLQYPIRLAYACTINKSQGQTLSRCGLVLHSPVFSHGQLYVAMSRVQRAADFKMWHTKRLDRPLDDNYFGMGILARNVVFQNVLRDRPLVEILEGIEDQEE